MNSPGKALLGIAAIMKNEGPYLVEWLAHHRCMGVQEFFIAANDNDDDNLRLFKALEDLGYLHLLLTPTRDGIKPQIPAYTALLDRFGSEVQWMAFIDADEFIWPTSDQHDLPSMVERFHAQTEVGAIALNWATYGSSRQVHFEDQPVIQRFDQRASDGFEINHHIKSIVRTKAVDHYLNPHFAVLHAGYQYQHTDGTPYCRKPSYFEKAPAALGLSESICWQDFRVNHYVIKSWNEYVDRKIHRGRAGSPNEGLNHDFFFFHDHNEVHDPVPWQHLQEVRIESQVIKAALLTKGIDNQLFGAMRGVQNKPMAPGLVNGSIEDVSLIGGELQITGWGLAWRDSCLDRIQVRANGTSLPLRRSVSVPRPDVQLHFPSAPLHAGFQLSLDRTLFPADLHAFEIQACAEGVDATPLPFGPDFDLGSLRFALAAPPSMPGHIDLVVWSSSGLEIEGWGLMQGDQSFVDFEVELDGHRHPHHGLQRLCRPDVQALHPLAPPQTGFRIRCIPVGFLPSPMQVLVYGITTDQQRFQLGNYKAVRVTGA